VPSRDGTATRAPAAASVLVVALQIPLKDLLLELANLLMRAR
jgi:hypothetical protein